jgi:hypothetical protein
MQIRLAEPKAEKEHAKSCRILNGIMQSIQEFRIAV